MNISRGDVCNPFEFYEAVAPPQVVLPYIYGAIWKPTPQLYFYSSTLLGYCIGNPLTPKLPLHFQPEASQPFCIIQLSHQQRVLQKQSGLFLTSKKLKWDMTKVRRNHHRRHKPSPNTTTPLLPTLQPLLISVLVIHYYTTVERNSALIVLMDSRILLQLSSILLSSWDKVLQDTLNKMMHTKVGNTTILNERIKFPLPSPEPSST